jgi:hypothetical protein
MNYAKIPCAECPWRTDIPIGKFPPERYVALSPTAYDLSVTVFACHMSKEGADFACAGFLLQSSVHNLSCRMTRTKFDDVRSPYPLFDTYRELAVANGVNEDHPALQHCRDDGQRTIEAES